MNSEQVTSDSLRSSAARTESPLWCSDPDALLTCHFHPCPSTVYPRTAAHLGRAGGAVLRLLRGAVLLVFALAADLLAALELQAQFSNLLEEKKRLWLQVALCGYRCGAGRADGCGGAGRL